MLSCTRHWPERYDISSDHGHRSHSMYVQRGAQFNEAARQARQTWLAGGRHLSLPSSRSRARMKMPVKSSTGRREIDARVLRLSFSLRIHSSICPRIMFFLAISGVLYSSGSAVGVSGPAALGADPDMVKGRLGIVGKPGLGFLTSSPRIDDHPSRRLFPRPQSAFTRHCSTVFHLMKRSFGLPGSTLTT